jgi:PAS domain S-box-containing protein
MATPPLRIAQPTDLAPLGDALTALGVGLTLVDRDMRVVWANGWITGLAEELSCGGNHCFSALWSARQRCPDCLPLLVFRTGEAQEGVRERGRPGAPQEAFRVRALPVADAGGAVRWVAESFVRLPALGTADGAGGRALAAEAAAASGAAFVVVDASERIVSWGPAAAEVFGYGLDEALGRRVDLIVPEGREAEERAVADEVARAGRFPRTETVRRARDGRLVPVALSAVALRDEAGALIGRTCSFEDLSVLHQLRARVAAQEGLLAHVTREAADAILGVGPDGRVTGFNRAAEGLLATAAADALGRPLGEVAGDAATAALLERVARERVVRGARATWRTARGEPVPVEVSAAVLAGGGVALVARDVSSQLELERRMMRSEKLAVVGSLAAGLAHEIGTPLNVISATAEWLMVDPPPGERERRLREIIAETDRISRLVRDLLAFSRERRAAGRAPLSVGDAVERARSLLAIPAEKKRVAIEADVPEGLPPVLAASDELHQVLVNLLMNAVEAVAPAGRVGVRARADAGQVAIDVHDDGPGVPEALRERVFDPFFTTRAEGTGLGLAVCARVVVAHGGDLRVGVGPWGGALFTVTLPSAEGAAPA